MLLLIYGEDMQEKRPRDDRHAQRELYKNFCFASTSLLILRHLETWGNDYRMTVVLQRQLA